MDTYSTLERVRAALPMALLVSFHPIAHVDEYVKFLALKLLRNDVDALPPALSPSHPVDAVWHTHMLHPHEYVRSCKALLSGLRSVAGTARCLDDGTALFKHSPVPRVDETRYVETLLLYEAVYGTKPNPLVWPDETLPPAQMLASAPPALAYAVPVAAAAAAAKTASPPKQFISVNVKTLSGRVYTVRISPDATVDQLKHGVHDLGAVSPCKQRLIFAGRHLEDAQVLRECDIRDGAAVHMVERLSGC